MVDICQGSVVYRQLLPLFEPGIKAHGFGLMRGLHVHWAHSHRLVVPSLLDIFPFPRGRGYMMQYLHVFLEYSRCGY